jgi:hypothetical protein
MDHGIPPRHSAIGWYRPAKWANFTGFAEFIAWIRRLAKRDETKVSVLFGANGHGVIVLVSMDVEKRQTANAQERLVVSLKGGKRQFRTIKVKSVRQSSGGGPCAGGVVGAAASVVGTGGDSLAGCGR